MKPITYYTSGEQLENLCEQFGYQLDSLDRQQKLELRIVLTYFVWGREQEMGDYSVYDAWVDSLQHLLCADEQITECLEILQGISVQDAESLLEALQAQCRTGNARLKSARETLTDNLLEHSVPLDLAETAATILTVTDNQRLRTETEQALISQVHKIIMGVNRGCGLHQE